MPARCTNDKLYLGWIVGCLLETLLFSGQSKLSFKGLKENIGDDVPGAYLFAQSGLLRNVASQVSSFR